MTVVVFDDEEDSWLANEEFYRRELLARLHARRDAQVERPAPPVVHSRRAGVAADPVHVDRRPRRGEWVTVERPSERPVPVFMAVHGEPDADRVVAALSRADVTARVALQAVGL